MRTLILLVLLLTAVTARATHIVGGEIYYTCLGNNQYRISFKMYRDCSPNNTNNTQYDNPATISIYNASGTLVTTVDLVLPPVNNLPAIINDPCYQVPANICVEEAEYEGIVNLPPITGGYDIVYQRCCYNPGVVNVFNSLDYGNTYWAHIPDPSIVTCNSSPRFTGVPPLVICNGSNFEFDNSATDPDGDVLVYSLYTPFEGGVPGNPLPIPASPPPYNQLPWNGGYSTTVQITGNPILGINSTTGLLTCKPNLNGLHIFGVKVSEYRNGILLSETYRNFQTTVTTCPATVVSAIPVQTEFCQGLTLQMDNNSLNSLFYLWDFGDINNPVNDTSTLETPSYTYGDTGVYTITLIANPGLWCADTAYSQYTVHAPLAPVFSTVSPQCIVGQDFDFALNGNFSSDAEVGWTFFDGNPFIDSTHQPQNITFNTHGYHDVRVVVNEYGCTDSSLQQILVFPMPQIGWYTYDTLGCEPYTVHFFDTTFSWTDVEYTWTFGDGTISHEQHPVHMYPQNGYYNVSLTIETDSVCISTQTLNVDSIIHVLVSPEAGFLMTPLENSVFTPWVEVTDQSAGGIGQVFHFDDGTSDSSTFVHHTYVESGYYHITQYVTNAVGCIDNETQTFYIVPFTTCYIPNTFTPNGDGTNDVFIPVVYDVSEYEFRIFDRWGEIIYQTNQLHQGWDGRRKNKNCPVGTYVYTVEFRDAESVRRVIRGHVNLVR